MAEINLESKKQLPILLTDGFFLFPKCQTSLPLEGNENLKKSLIRIWQSYQGQFLMISSKKEREATSEKIDNFYSTGTWGKIILDLSQEENTEFVINSLKSIQLEGLERVQIINPIHENGYWRSEYQIVADSENNKNEKVLNELTEKFVRYLPNILERTNLSFADKLPYLAMGNLGNFVDFLAQNISGISREIKQAILSTSDLRERLDYLLSLQKPKDREIDKDINAKVNKKIQKEQRVFYLREKKKEIEKELRDIEGSSNEIQKYSKRLEEEPFPDYVKKVVNEEIGHYENMPPGSGREIIEYYIALIMSLPWYKKTDEIYDLKFAREILDKEHYGLEKPKERIIESLAARQKAKENLPEIICFVGPPGVGKTSLAKSIAEATGRKFAKIPLGGISDEAEIRGHRRTYQAALPGKIVQTMKKVEVINPLILLDEIDKISNFRGDPASALLEVLDPGQNKNFIDNYLGLEVPYDLSKVMFICTANSTDLPRPLLDRLEIIFLSSYTETEKRQIAQQYLIPEVLKTYNLTEEKISFQAEAIEKIIKHYTREAGVRELNRKIQEIIRKFLVQLIQNKLQKLIISSENLKDYLGKEIFDFTQKQNHPQAGVVNGLAYTEFGGDILPIEASYSPGKSKLTLTGRLGEVMKESAQVALSFVKVNFQSLGIELDFFAQNDIYIHAPEGAVPKEGPSAGITLATAIISAATGQPVSEEIGMTGEITLTGKILKIGGLKEKAIAAQRSGLKTILIPKDNENDCEKIPTEVKNKLKIILVSEYSEVWKFLFGKSRKKIPPRANEKKEIVFAA